MVAELEATVRGLEGMRECLRALPARLRLRALRNALTLAGRVVRDAARAETPVISPTDPKVLRGERRPGTVRRALSVRTSKQARRAGDVGVFVNVRPAKGARYQRKTSVVRGKVITAGTQLRASQRGAKNPADSYYWRWLNFGARGRRGAEFLEAGVRHLGAALRKFEQTLAPLVQKFDEEGKGS